MAKNVKKIPSVSIAICMPEESLDFVDAQIKKGYYSSREEFFNSAITLLKWAVGVAEGGEEVSSYQNTTSVVTPIEFNSKIKALHLKLVH